MRAYEFLPEAQWDPSGWGGTPYGTDIDYFGIRVKMRPSTFLKLAAPLDRTQMNPHVKKHMQGGGKIAPPMLDVKIPAGWEDGDFHDYAEVASHEGRNRVMNWIEMRGDEPIQVNIIGRGGMRRRHFSPEIIERLSQGMHGERGRMFVRGPLFDVGTVLEEGVMGKVESARQLYHATLASNVQSILANGLNPTVGEFTKSIYGNKAKPLVFAADIKGSRGVYCALQSQIGMKLGKFPPSAEEIAKYGAILVISKDVGKFKQYNSNRRSGSKEPTDYTSTQQVHIDHVITGQELLQWIKTHNADWGEMSCPVGVSTVLEENTVNEIGYAPGISNSKISDAQYIQEGNPVGEIDNHTVWHWIGKDIYTGNHAYFFTDSNTNPTKVLCRIVFADYGNRFELTTLKNISGVKGAITALCIFVVKKLNKPFVLPSTEPLTQDGINWLCKLIMDKGRGLKLSDQTGNFPDVNVLRQEWINAKYNGGHGKTSIMFENNEKSTIFNPKIKRIDETYQWLEKSLLASPPP